MFSAKTWNEALEYVAKQQREHCKYKVIFIMDETYKHSCIKSMALKNLVASEKGHSGAHKSYQYEICSITPHVNNFKRPNLILFEDSKNMASYPLEKMKHDNLIECVVVATNNSTSYVKELGYTLTPIP
jgi:hypothetical protein